MSYNFFMDPLREMLSLPDGPVDTLPILEAEKYLELLALINAGHYPPDTLLRLDSACEQRVPSARDPIASRPQVLHELVDNVNSQDRLSPYTRSLIFGETPKALLIWDHEEYHKLLAAYKPSYYLKDHLVNVIRQRRVDEAKTVKVVPEDRRWQPPDQVELSQCMRIAHRLWHTLANRIIPEWVKPDTVHSYYRLHKSGTLLDGGCNSYVVERRVIGAIALRADFIRGIYEESLDKTGVPNIGPLGRTDLRTLLADEYSELY